MNLFLRIYGFIIHCFIQLNNKALSAYKSSIIKGNHGGISGRVTLANPRNISLGKNSYGNTAQKSRRDTARSDIIKTWINR